jgi:hypothetical protein
VFFFRPAHSIWPNGRPTPRFHCFSPSHARTRPSSFPLPCPVPPSRSVSSFLLLGGRRDATGDGRRRGRMTAVRLIAGGASLRPLDPGLPPRPALPATQVAQRGHSQPASLLSRPSQTPTLDPAATQADRRDTFGIWRPDLPSRPPSCQFLRVADAAVLVDGVRIGLELDIG